VQNGSGRSGLGSSVLSALGKLGFAVLAPATNADRSDYTVTEVEYAPGQDVKARLVLSTLGGAGQITPLDGASGGADVVLVLGHDYRGVSAPAIAAPSTAKAAPASTHKASGATVAK